MLKLHDVSAYYGESSVIRNLDLEVPDHKTVCLIGRNGVGKSTTLKSIMGLVKTPEGSICLGDQEMIKMATYDRAKLGIGYVPQGRDIFPQMTVQENLELGLKTSKEKKVPDYIWYLQQSDNRQMRVVHGSDDGGRYPGVFPAQFRGKQQVR